MKKELEGEMGILDNDLLSASFLGIARNRVTQGPEALYVAQLGFSKADLMESWQSTAKDTYEHRHLTFYTKSDVLLFLEQQKGHIVPSGEAALTLFARHYC